MPRCRVVCPRIDRLQLSDGDWLDVVKELNAGEWFDMIVAMQERKPFAKVMAYVLGWSLLGLDDQPVPYGIEQAEDERRATIRALDKGTVREIIVAIDRHEASEEAAIEKKRATKDTVPSLSVASPSVA